jgi:hypothetical protein
MKRMFHNGRYANVAATLALVLAMCGTSYAAVTLQHNSVGSWQIRPAAVKNTDIGSSSVTSGKVRNGTLKSVDFAPGQLPASSSGPAAYTAILGNGLPKPGAASRGFPPGDVSHVLNTGIYCFRGLSFTPRSAVATIMDNGALTAVPFTASVEINNGGGLAGCSYSFQQARVTITKVDDVSPPALTDHDFSIWFEK